jgi:uncharacterized membrane protein
MISIELIHPMVVHFPIVFIVVAAILDLMVMARGGSLSDGSGLSRAAIVALTLAGVSAVAAYIFGDIALDSAVAKGFPEAMLEEHEGLGTATMALIVALVVIRIGALWRGFSLAGARGWILSLGSLAAVGVMLAAAFHGGELVYQLGVNVAAAKP